MSVLSLGYVGFQASDLAAWNVFATHVLGVMAAEDDGATKRYRVDQQSWRIAVEPGPADDIVLAGFEVAGQAELDELAARLTEAGIAVEDAPAELLKRRGVLGLKRTLDPEGLSVELYYGPTERTENPFVSPVGISGFVTGEQGLGHIVLASPNIVATRRFYTDLLGFRLSDVITFRMSPDVAFDLEFYHCNPRHHTLALAPVPAPKRIHHFMLQVNSIDEVGFALERIEQYKVPLVQTLGRHPNDQMLSFYARTPSGFEVECGCDAIEIDEATWRVVRHDVLSSWGHKRAGSNTGNR